MNDHDLAMTQTGNPPPSLSPEQALAESEKTRAEIEALALKIRELILAHRYQVLEKEFFEFVLAPHDDALQQAYGVNSHAIALGIQAISDSLRVGFSNATLAMQESFSRHQSLRAAKTQSKEEAIAELRSQNPEFDAKIKEAWPRRNGSGR